MNSESSSQTTREWRGIQRTARDKFPACSGRPGVDPTPHSHNGQPQVLHPGSSTVPSDPWASGSSFSPRSSSGCSMAASSLEVAQQHFDL